MAGKVDARPGAAICRCCFAEGCYKDISNEYFWMGKREVYAEMLSETLDITISYSQSSGPNSQTRLICEACIARLRDASDFKRQVLECEKTFLLHLDGGIEVTVEQIEKDEKEVKLERVKEEVKISDEEYDNAGFPDDPDFPDDDDDDMDDEPLTKLASKIPKKESVDISDLPDNSKAEKRKSSTKTKATPAKKPKKSEVKPKATTSKAAMVKPTTSAAAGKATAGKATAEKKKRAGFASEGVETNPVRRNAQIILQYSTAYPFRVNGKSIVCVYCNETYEDPNIFRPHMDEEHSTFNLKVAFHDLPKAEFIKADITSLRCRICTHICQDLDAMAKHLHETHDKSVNFDEKLGVMPYFLQKDMYNCAVCMKNVPSIFHLNRHTVTHFLSFVCHVCGSSYIASTGLSRHVRSKHQDYQVICNSCKKVFPNMDAKEKHRRTEKPCMPYTCTKCPERFPDYHKRKKHLETEHGDEKKIMECLRCDVSFTRQGAYYDHFKLQHSSDAVVCKHCGSKFLSVYKLKRHIKKHSAAKRRARKNTMALLRYSTAYPVHIGVNYLRCMVCRKRYTTPIEFRSHMDGAHHQVDMSNVTYNSYYKPRHVDVKGLRCKICSVKLENLDTLTMHLNFDHDLNFKVGPNHLLIPLKLDIGNFSCLLCSQKFDSICALYTHSLEHVHRPVFLCEICGKHVHYEKTFKDHLYNHRVGDYNCLHCKQAFPTIEKKREHVRTSKDCMKVKCDHCSEKFTHKELKQKHMADKHGKPQEMHSCIQCTKQFKYRTSLYCHIRQAHTKDYICKQCDKTFANTRKLEHHINRFHDKIKPYPCNVCERRFYNRNSLKRHSHSHEERKFACPICEVKSKRKDHLQSHIKNKHSGIVSLDQSVEK